MSAKLTFESQKTKFKVGDRLRDITLEVREDNRIYLHFDYNKQMLDIVKTTFEGRKWHGPPVNPNGPKIWSIPITHRNLFRIDYLKNKYGSQPFKRFESDFTLLFPKIKEYCLQRFPSDKQPYAHQMDLIAHGVSTKRFLWAAEMGTGKTLAALTVIELCALWYGIDNWWWCGPLSALRSTHLEMMKWDFKLRDTMRLMSYEELKRIVERWNPNDPTPNGLIGDESSKLKTPTAQRTVMFKHVADSMRTEYGDDGCCIGELSGSPAPKSPLDWYSQAEIAQPGFLYEGNFHLFKERLAIVEERERYEGGGKYPHLVAWRDSEDKCHFCGLPKDHKNHSVVNGKHVYQPCKNEVARLKNRLDGLVLVKFKADCLDLPEKIYEEKRVVPTEETINCAKIIIKSARSTVDALIKLRMLSDGFQYIDEKIGECTCELCEGNGKHWEYIVTGVSDGEEVLSKVECECPNCKGSGRQDMFRRETKYMDCPKDDLLREDLDNHEEIGRFNIYAGFTGSIDRITKICHQEGWTTVRADGRGWEGKTPLGEILPNKALLEIYTMERAKFPRMCFIGQPGSAGMGLTLTVSPTTAFFSNDFNAENRMQAEDRGHRIGMDVERGGRITDYIHLDTDLYVLENLKKKRDLQYMSLTGLQNYAGIN